MAAMGCSGGSASESTVAGRELIETLPERGPHVATISGKDCVRWRGFKTTGSHLGGFETCSGFMSFDSDDTLRAVEVEVDVTSMIADHDKLRLHLLSPDFFDAERFPTATFKSMAVRPLESSKEGMRHEVQGAMTIRGVTRRMTVVATVKRVEDHWEADARFALPRFDFEMTYMGKPDDPIENEANVVVSLRAPYDPRGIVAEEVGP